MSESREHPSLELCVQFSDDGQHIRKWSRLPFDGGTNLYSHPTPQPESVEVSQEWTTLEDCPPGPFEFEGHLGFKTEYRAMETVGPVSVPGDQIRWKVGRWSDVYCMGSGEIFWGGTSTKEDRAKLMVRPVDVATIHADDAPVRAALAEAIEALKEYKRDFCEGLCDGGPHFNFDCSGCRAAQVVAKHGDGR